MLCGCQHEQYSLLITPTLAGHTLSYCAEMRPFLVTQLHTNQIAVIGCMPFNAHPQFKIHSLPVLYEHCKDFFEKVS